MKLKCSRCDSEEARLFCCADEAAFCFGCDQKIHAANLLVSKHQRVSLSSASSSPRPKCDICQETVGFFLCLEDRAFLCRKCDVAIHTINPLVSSHQRFLLAGAKVGLESTDELSKSTDTEELAAPSARNGNLAAADTERIHGDGKVTAITTPNPAISTDSQAKDILDLFGTSGDNYPSSQDELSKAEGKVHGNSEWWKILHSTEEELLNGEWTTPNDGAPFKGPQLLRHCSPHLDSGSSRNTGGFSSHKTMNISDSAGSPRGADSQNHSDSAFTKRRRCINF